MMTAHEFARQLLAGPDLPVVVHPPSWADDIRLRDPEAVPIFGKERDGSPVNMILITPSPVLSDALATTTPVA